MVTKIRPYNPGAGDLVPSWHVIDASDQVLGRIATRVATLIMGKHKPGYVAHLPSGDFVVVTNAAKIRTSGKKAGDKVYLRHNQQPGHLKKVPYRTEMQSHPDRVLQHAVKGMLPKNKLGDRLLTHLKVYAGPEHPHSAQVTGSTRLAEKTAEAARAAAAAPVAIQPTPANVAAVTESGTEKKPPRVRKQATAATAEAPKAPVIRRPRAPGAKPAPAKKAASEKKE
jgi:large subunit ribosomal protein L13